MKVLKILPLTLIACLFIWACGTPSNINSSEEKEQPVVIANDSLEYEITIIDPGFTAYLAGTAFPPGYYSQNYLENRNRVFVTTWNFRAQNPARFNPNIYETFIDYLPTVNYGYDVNYKLFNYFLFAQQKYRMSLNGIGRPDQKR